MSVAFAPPETRIIAVTEPTSDRLFVASARMVVRNYCSAAALILLGLAFYSCVPYYAAYFTPLQHGVLQLVALGYLLALPAYYATFPDTFACKCRLLWQAVAHLPRRWPTAQEANAMRAVAVKAFFMPLMVMWLTATVASLPALWNDLTLTGPVGFHYLCLNTLILIDLSFFAVAYGLEHPRLGNEVRSAEPTLLGWFAALVCYPPFTLLSVRLLGWYEVDAPQSDSLMIALPVSLLMLMLMGTYAWASVALGLKGGNLTNRGTVDRGPYQFVRHPAYLCKNLFWCIGAVPAFFAAWGNGLLMAAVAFSSFAWFTIYTLRALTEERHLMRDPEYQAYCQRVRYRYIPGVW